MEIPRITPAQVAQRVARGERIAFVDARSAKAYEQAAEQIPGSTRIPPDGAAEEYASSLPRDATVVAYCT